MKVQILFFGATADATGEREIEIDLANDAKADAAFACIVETFPQLKNIRFFSRSIRNMRRAVKLSKTATNSQSSRQFPAAKVIMSNTKTKTETTFTNSRLSRSMSARLRGASCRKLAAQPLLWTVMLGNLQKAEKRFTSNMKATNRWL